MASAIERSGSEHRAFPVFEGRARYKVSRLQALDTRTKDGGLTLRRVLQIRKEKPPSVPKLPTFGQRLASAASLSFAAPARHSVSSLSLCLSVGADGNATGALAFASRLHAGIRSL